LATFVDDVKAALEATRDRWAEVAPGTFQIAFDLEGREYLFHIETNEAAEALANAMIVRALVSDRTPEARQAEIEQLVARLNLEAPFGAVYLDPRDSSLIARTGVAVSKDAPTDIDTLIICLMNCRDLAQELHNRMSALPGLSYEESGLSYEQSRS
jgi:hypothetical protein